MKECEHPYVQMVQDSPGATTGKAICMSCTAVLSHTVSFSYGIAFFDCEGDDE